MGEKNKPNIGEELLHNDEFLKRLSSKFMISSILSIAMLYASMMINTIIVGMYLGEKSLAVMSLVGPVGMIYYTTGAMAIGGSIVATHHIGKNDYLGYRQVFTCTVGLLVLACIVMTALGYVFFEPMISMLSGGSENKVMVADYMRFYLPGGIGTMMELIPLHFLRIDGRPKASAMLFILSSVLNVFLGWLFVGPACNMGIRGVSLATSLAMSVTAILGFVVLLHGRQELRLVKGSFTKSNIRNILITGTPTGMATLLESARIILVNMLLLQVGTDMLLSSFTVVRNVMDMLIAIMIGTASALLPLIGVFYSECDHVNIRNVMKIALRVGMSITIPMILLVSLFPDAISSLFGIVDPQILAENRLALPLTCMGLGFGYINILYSRYFGAVEREWIANVILLLRLLLYVALFSVALSGIMGSVGIWASFSLAELATMLTYFLIRKYLRYRNRSLDIYLLDSKKEADVDITFSVRNNVDDIVFASDRITNFCEDNKISIKKATKVGLAVEEILTFLIKGCLNPAKEQSVDIRVCKLDDDVMIRFRYTGAIFDPVHYYEAHKDDEEMKNELLGLNLIINTSLLIDFRQTFGANNLMIRF